MDNVRLMDAIKQYAEGKISLGKAAELADISIWKFLDVMRKKGISINHNLEDIKKETERIVREDVEWGLSDK